MRAILIFVLGCLIVTTCQSQKQRVITESGIKKVNLSDGMVICLNSSSSVSYPKTFTGANRTIEETGEVYLEVPKSSSSVVIKAKGIGNIICHSNTRINIMNYREDSCSRVVVVSGMATIDIGKNKDKVELREGEAYEMLGSVNGETIYIDGRQSISWMREIPVYYMLKLRVILNALQRNFRVKIDAKDKDILETTYTTSYEPGENVETVLKGLADIGHLSFEKNGMNGYEIRRKGK